MAKRKAPFKRVQDDPRWKPGAWVFCTQPYGFYTLSICASGGCAEEPFNRVHGFPGLLSKKEFGNGQLATVADHVRQKIRKLPNQDTPALTISACLILPDGWHEGEVPDGEAEEG